MRIEKFFGLFLTMSIALGLWACDNTVSSSDSRDQHGLNYISGYNPDKAKAKPKPNSSSSKLPASSASVGSSSSFEDVSSSSETMAPLDSLIDVAETCDVSECLEAVSEDLLPELEELMQQLDELEEPTNFSGIENPRLAVNDLDFSKKDYYCYTISDEWYVITKDELVDAGLSYVWSDEDSETLVRYLLDFENVCDVVYVRTN